MPYRVLTLAALLTLNLLSSQTSANVAGGSSPVSSLISSVQPFSVNAPDGWVFQGELTLPAGAHVGQKFPTILLIHGAGIGDMNETVPEEVAGVPDGSANFLTIARRLNAAGFAVARFNKRGVTGVGPQTIDPEKMVGAAYTPTGIAQDAWTLLQYVRQQPNVDPERFFLLGHSEGTGIVSKLAAEHPRLVRGVVTISVIGDSPKSLLRLQLVDNQVGYAHLLDRDKDGDLSEAEVNDAPPALNMWLGIWTALGVLSSENERYHFTPAIDPQGQQRVKISAGFTSFLATYFDQSYPNLSVAGPNTGAYLQDLDRFGYVTTLLPRYPGAVLMMNGENDDQTPASSAVRAYQAVKDSGNPDVTLKLYPGMGHTLAPLRDGFTTAGPINEAALTDLTRWLKDRAN